VLLLLLLFEDDTMSPAQPVTTFWRLAGMSYLQVRGVCVMAKRTTETMAQASGRRALCGIFGILRILVIAIASC